MNVVLVSHCGSEDQSWARIFGLAAQLCAAGLKPIVFVPDASETLDALAEASFRVAHYHEALREPLVFANGQGPDLIHAWTPREPVRRLTDLLVRRYAVPYLVHLEDSEESFVESALRGPSYSELGTLPLPFIDQLLPPHLSHPARYPEFLSGAAGITAAVDKLLEFKPAGVPGLVCWPGFDAAFAQAPSDDSFRTTLGLAGSDLLLVCNDDMGSSSVAEVESLVVGVAALRRRGRPVVLAHTGRLPLGDLPKLTAAADVLVQPGHATASSEYRFPSRLPEFLVSGRPVVLPRTNMGRFLQDGVDCVLCDTGHALEVAARLEPLLADRPRRDSIGAAGRAFALRELTWSGAAARVAAFYEEVLARGGASSASPKGAKPPAPEPDWWVKLIAFYLPQFHPIPENDAWWGEGFTEWTNVKRATPNFAGHYQPQVPTDLGYYDLRDAEVMDKQAALAKAHGIHGFCFYYYWFNGHRLLEKPLDQFLSRGKPDFPFCLCWANENWTRRWDGSEDKMLMEQAYAPGYAEQLISDMIPVMKDPRYIKVGGAPLLLVYRADLLPDPAAAAHEWRETCAGQGIPEIHLAAVQSFGITDPRPYGFDAAVEFPPHTECSAAIPHKGYKGIVKDFRGLLEDYVEAARIQIEQPSSPFIRYRGVMPGWDNTPRRMNRAHAYVNSSPSAYQTWLRQMVEQTVARASVQEPLLFLNAWNEWGEGAYLEPDSRDGYARLEATKDGLCLGLADYFAHRGFPVTPQMVEQVLIDQGVLAGPAPPTLGH